ncbi:MAG: DUF975 family protein [Eubacterium sp.]|nr:DUF975 family protein [Eubacterium sp.]
MNLDRSLIKSQAKQLIKGNVFKFFVIIFVVSALTGGGLAYSSGTSAAQSIGDTVDSGSYGLENADEYDFDEFTQEIDPDEFDFNEFANGVIGEAEQQASKPKSALSTIAAGISSITSLLGIFLAPLAITLAGVFYSLIKGKNMSWNEEFSYVFSKTFDKNYWNKFLLNLLTGIFTVLWSLLFIIPGIVYYYKIYFVNFIMAEKPELSWKEAVNISKKMTDGHKGELFVLDLSFIGWDILTGLTLGLVGIYVLPYQYTTKALYYENFKIRAFQLGAMSEADFMTEGEKVAIVYANAQQQGGYNIPAPAPQAPVQQAPVQQENNQSVDYTYQQVETPVDTDNQPPSTEE